MLKERNRFKKALVGNPQYSKQAGTNSVLSEVKAKVHYTGSENTFETKLSRHDKACTLHVNDRQQTLKLSLQCSHIKLF